MTAATAFTDLMLEAGGMRIQMVSGGSGEPLLILHNQFGHPGILPYHEHLAGRFSLKIPYQALAPERPDIFQFRDLVAAYVPVLRDLGMSGCKAIGFGFGAWIAAELAAFNPSQFSKMVLVAPMGIKPREGDIRHFLIRSRRDVVEECFHNPASVSGVAELYGGREATPEQREFWEQNRGRSRALLEAACSTWRARDGEADPSAHAGGSRPRRRDGAS
jgi:pimeloyl-ACP methyl ester carboxylesterase